MAYTKVTSTSQTFYLRTRTMPHVFSDLSSKLFKLERTRTGNYLPGWRKLISEHRNATTVMSGVYESFAYSRMLATVLKLRDTGGPGPEHTDYVYSNGAAAQIRYLPGTLHTNPDIVTTVAQSRARQLAFKKIRDAQFSMSGGTFIGELGEAIRMLRHPAEGLRKALKSDYLDKLKTIKKKDPNRWKKAISQSWLEGCFGWRPFINDLEDAVKAYKEATNVDRNQYQKIRAVGKDQLEIDLITDDRFSLGGLFPHMGWKHTYDEAFCIIRSEVKRELNVTAAGRARIFGLTPEEFVPTAWELLPWSFLVDYFTNVGDILAAGATDTSRLAWIEQSVVAIRNIEALVQPDVLTCKQINGANYIGALGNPGSFLYKRRIVTRSVPSTLSLPDFTLELPGSPIKQLNCLALWTQANSMNPQDARKLRGRTFR